MSRGSAVVPAARPAVRRRELTGELTAEFRELRNEDIGVRAGHPVDDLRLPPGFPSSSTARSAEASPS
ncbi:MAG: hypothetical protein HY511_04515 [Actinobacteria bacterium]|nr:hypothetical protein [Actinomycetota bacterium]